MFINFVRSYPVSTRNATPLSMRGWNCIQRRYAVKFYTPKKRKWNSFGKFFASWTVFFDSVIGHWRDTSKSVDSWPTSGLQLRGSREVALSIRSRSRGILYYSPREFMPDFEDSWRWSRFEKLSNSEHCERPSLIRVSKEFLRSLCSEGTWLLSRN